MGVQRYWTLTHCSGRPVRDPLTIRAAGPEHNTNLPLHPMLMRASTPCSNGHVLHLLCGLPCPCEPNSGAHHTSLRQWQLHSCLPPMHGRQSLGLRCVLVCRSSPTLQGSCPSVWAMSGTGTPHPSSCHPPATGSVLFSQTFMASCRGPSPLKRSVSDARLPAIELSGVVLPGGQLPHNFCCVLGSSVKGMRTACASWHSS